MSSLGVALGSFWGIVVLFLLILAILWFILPFAIFGTKPRLEALLEEQKKTNAWLQELVIETKAKGGAQPPASSGGRHISFDRP